MTNRVVLTGIINDKSKLESSMFGNVPCITTIIETTNQKGDKPRYVPITLMGYEAQEFKRMFETYRNLVLYFVGEITYLYQEQKVLIQIHNIGKVTTRENV